MTTLLSVVLPTHDRPVALAQEGAGFEIELVVVDDGSSSETQACCGTLATEDPRVRVVHHPRPLGAAAARNTGIDAAAGELVGFCDDDEWLPGAAARALARLEQTPVAGVVHGDTEVFHVRTGRRALARPPLECSAELFRWVHAFGNAFAIARREAVTDALRFDDSLPTSEDWDLWLRCAERAPVVGVPAPLYRYTQHHGPRLTGIATSQRQAEGYAGLLAKHRASRTAACALHHELLIELTRAGRGGLAEALAERRHERGLPTAAAMVGARIAASRIGVRRGDPALVVRMLARTVPMLERRRGGTAAPPRSRGQR